MAARVVAASLLCLTSHSARITIADVNSHGAKQLDGNSCRAKLVERMNEQYVTDVCAVLESGELKDGESVDVNSIGKIVYHDKGVACKPHEYKEMCGMSDEVVQDEVAQEEIQSAGSICRAELVEREDEDYVAAVCDALKKGELKDGTHVDATTIGGIVSEDKGVKCSVAGYKQMCGITDTGADTHNAPATNTVESVCKTKLDERAGEEYAHFICAALHFKHLKDGESVDAEKIAGIIAEDKGVSCTTAQLTEMCSAMKVSCEAQLTTLDEELVDATCEALRNKRFNDGSSADAETLAKYFNDKKGTECDAEGITQMCS